MKYSALYQVSDIVNKCKCPAGLLEIKGEDSHVALQHVTGIIAP